MGSSSSHSTGILVRGRTATATAIGLGYHPGARVDLIWAPAVATNFPLHPFASSVVGPRGRFYVSFPVTTAMTGGRPLQTITIEAYEGQIPGVGAKHAYAVAPLVIYSPAKQG